MTDTTTNVVVLSAMGDAEIGKAIKAIVGETTIAKTKTFEIAMADFPMVAIKAFLLHGAQRKFNDSVGGKDKTTDMKVEGVELMIAEYKNGIVKKARNGGGVPVDNVQKLARSHARKALKVKLAEMGKDYKALFGNLEPSAQNEKLDSIVERAIGTSVDYKATAQAEIDARKAATESIDLDDLGL